MQWVGYPSFQEPFIQNRELCLGYLEQGKLYSGDPYCFQGPVMYIVAEIFTKLFPHYGLYVLYFFSIFLTSLFLYLINNKETGGIAGTFLCFISIFLFAKLIWYDFATVVVIIFLMSGFYLLYYSSLSQKELAGGLLLAAAMFSKTHVFFVVIPLLFFYLYSLCMLAQGQTFLEKIKACWKNEKKKMLFLLMPVVVVFVILLLWVPGFVFYDYIVHTYNPTVQSYYSIFKELITAKYYYNGYILLLYLGMFITLFRLVFYKKLDVFSSVGVICFGIMMIGVATKFSLYRLSDQYRYFLPFAPFYFINLLKFGKEFKEKHDKIQWVILLLICLVMGGIFYSTLSGLTIHDLIQNKGINEQKLLDRFKSELEAPLFEIPKGQILIDGNIYNKYDLVFDENPFVALNESDFISVVLYNENESLNPDMAVSNNFVVAGVLPSLDAYMHPSIIPWAEHFEKWRNGSYTAIINYAFQSHLFILSDILKNSNNSLSHDFCMLKIPAYIEGAENTSDHFMYIFMYNNNNACEKMMQFLVYYYNKNADHFCDHGKEFVDIINNALSFEGIMLNNKCTHTSSLILLNNTWKFQSIYLCILLTGYLVYLLWTTCKIKY